MSFSRKIICGMISKSFFTNNEDAYFFEEK